MAVDIFLVISGIPGGSTAPGFVGAIEVQSFSTGISNPITIGSGSGGTGAGKAQFSDVSIVKQFDLASTPLMNSLATGKVITKAVLTFVKAGPVATPFLTYELDGVFVTSIQDSASSGGGAPTEAVSFAFEKLFVTYKEQDAKGGTLKTETFGFDRTTNDPT